MFSRVNISAIRLFKSIKKKYYKLSLFKMYRYNMFKYFQNLNTKCLKTMKNQQFFYFKLPTIDFVRVSYELSLLYFILYFFPFIFQDSLHQRKISDLGLRTKMPKGLFFFMYHLFCKQKR